MNLKLLQMVFESTTEGIIITDADGAILYANKSMCKQTGHALTELIGQNPRIYSTGKYSKQFYQKMFNTLQFAHTWTGVVINRKKSGSSFHVQVSISTIVGNDGSIEYYVGMYHTVKRIKKTPEEVSSIAKFVEKSPNPIIRISASGKVIFANATGQLLIECLSTKVGGIVSDDWVYIIGECIELQQVIERELICHDRVMNLLIAPVSSEGHVDIFGHDITEEREVRQHLQLFRYLLDQSNDTVFVIEPKTGKLVDINDTACRELGHSKDVAMLMDLQDIDCKLSSTHAVKDFISTVIREKSVIVESLFRKHDGSTFPVEMSCKFITRHQTDYIVITTRNITERKKQERELKDLAFKDPLTGIANRRLFEEQLMQQTARARRQKQPYALMLLDLDDFGTINDTKGHEVGDNLLKSIAQRMKQTFKRETDIVARLGGDEFVVLVTEFDDKSTPMEQCNIMCQKLMNRLEQPHATGRDGTIVATASVGCALVINNTKSANDITRLADEAMYVAKKNGKNSFHVITD